MVNGLDHSPSSLPMLPSFAVTLPTGYLPLPAQRLAGFPHVLAAILKLSCLSLRYPSRVQCSPLVRMASRSAEQGVYYAMDLGGTNFRMLRVQLGEDEPVVRIKQVAIPPPAMQGTAEALFAFIASNLVSVTISSGPAPRQLNATSASAQLGWGGGGGACRESFSKSSRTTRRRAKPVGRCRLGFVSPFP
jgi:hypothetical protein